MINKLKTLLLCLRYLPWSIYLNFHYLPCYQAIKLPIILYKPKLLHCGGKVLIMGGVRFGMIRLGFNHVKMYPNTGIIWENKGTIVFHGQVGIGNASSIAVGQNGHLEIGARFGASCGLKLVCYNTVKFGDDVLIGWDCIVSDTDLHASYKDGVKRKGFGTIFIGDKTWIAMRCILLKGTSIPANCIIGAGSIVTKNLTKAGARTLISGIPAKIVSHDCYRCINDDCIDYSAT